MEVKSFETPGAHLARELQSEQSIINIHTIAGVACDVAVGSAGARFKSHVLGLMNRMDPRFGQLVRLVKAWAKAHDCNSPADGTFNTFALCLMVCARPHLLRVLVVIHSIGSGF